MTPRFRAIGWRDHAVGFALCASYIAVLLATAPDLGMGRDEGFYVVAADRYGAWFEQLFTDPNVAVQRDVVEGAWSYNSEHPPLMKSLFALSKLAQDRWEIFGTPSLAYRFPGMLFAGALLWLIYIFGARAYGRQTGAFAALAFALMPRVFYHAHLDCFDVPIVLMMTLVTYCYWRSLSDPRWAIATGIVYGFALATKHNSWTLPIIFLIHWWMVVWTELYARKTKGAVIAVALALPLIVVPILEIVAWRKNQLRRVRLVPWWFFAMIALGIPIFIGLWPRLWYDTIEHFNSYAAFHLNHEYYNMAYFGVNYFRPPFPISYPFVMLLFTVPLATVALATFGIAARARALLPPGWMERLWPHGTTDPDPARIDVLAFGSMLAPILVIAMPWTPIFGGTKHWFSAYPFLALFAGVAFVSVARQVRQSLPPKLFRAKYGARLGAAIILLAPGAIETVHSHPFGLSHYTFAAGGVPGAADYGMNRQFWGFTTGSLSEWFNTQMPDGGSVWICDTTHTAWQMLQRDGRIRTNIRASGDMISADYAIVHHEHHFVEVDYQIWQAYGSVAPVHVLTYDGVPIVSVYENPRHAARRDAVPRNQLRSGPVR